MCIYLQFKVKTVYKGHSWEPVAINRMKKMCTTVLFLFQKPFGPTTPNVRKAPNKPPGKFFKSSPKNRSSNKPKHNKDETWFDIDSVFGFED